jgi:hypothetical protein
MDAKTSPFSPESSRDKDGRDKQNGQHGLTFVHACPIVTLLCFGFVFIRVIRVIRGDFLWWP